MQTEEFRELVLTYYRQKGRTFPWRETTDPYAITVSELMLQQTQTERVVPKYQAFLRELPTWQALAGVPVAELLRLWQGLGYNRRALHLKKLAQVVVEEYSGILPTKYEELIKLPGIGPYTAGAILAFAFNQPVAMIETNIRRVYLHHFFPGEEKVPDRQLLPLIKETMVKDSPREWYHALMDYGSQLAKELPNPNRRSAHYSKQSTFEGSNRQLRGRILHFLTEQPKYPRPALREKLQDSPDRADQAIEQLAKEGFLMADQESVWLP